MIWPRMCLESSLWRQCLDILRVWGHQMLQKMTVCV